MDVFAAARSLNQRAVQQNWHHFCDPALSFSDLFYKQMLDLWHSKARGRKMPTRSDFTPRDLKNMLRNIVIFERVSENPSSYRWRLIGTAITDIAGHHTGKTLEETIPPEHLERYIKCGDLILDGGKPMRFLGRVQLNGREYLEAENLFVPLANDNDVPTFAMGLCRYTPRRSNEEDSWENQLASLPGGLL